MLKVSTILVLVLALFEFALAQEASSFASLFNERLKLDYSVALQDGARTEAFDSLEAINCRAVRKILKDGADVNERLKNQETPLHFATRLKATKIVELLLNREADPNLADRDGATPLHFASRSSSEAEQERRLHRSMVFHLLRAGANPNARTTRGVTPLHALTGARSLGFYEDAELVVMLLKAGANPNAVSDCCSNTPLHLAAAFCSPHVVSILLKSGGDSTIVNAQNRTALEVAKHDRRPEIVKLLQGDHNRVEK